MQSLIRSKSAGVTGGRGTAGAGPGRDLLQPLLPKKTLRIAARANSAFLTLLCNEVPCCFLAQSISNVSAGFQWLDTINAQYISEVDCKDQINHICPSAVADHLQKGSHGLAARKNWRMTNLEWSIHKDTKKLDRLGRSTWDATQF